MNSKLRTAIDTAFQQAEQALAAKEPLRAYPWLERAHILSQRLPMLHACTHWLMLRAGWQQRDYREMLGQITRIMAALLFTKLWVPIGNTGRARVSAFRPMPVPKDLQRLLQGKHQ